MPQHTAVASLCVGLCWSAISLDAQTPSWRNKPIPDWTKEEAYQVLTDSPWVKNLRPGLLHQQSEFERRDGGNMGRAHGLGYDGLGDEESVFASRRVGEVPTLLLRWETALPVRAAGRKVTVVQPPTVGDDVYALAVYGVRVERLKGDPLKLGKPLKSQAVLRRTGKKDIKPIRVEVFPSTDGPINEPPRPN